MFVRPDGSYYHHEMNTASLKHIIQLLKERKKKGVFYLVRCHIVTSQSRLNIAQVALEHTPRYVYPSVWAVIIVTTCVSHAKDIKPRIEKTLLSLEQLCLGQSGMDTCSTRGVGNYRGSHKGN